MASNSTAREVYYTLKTEVEIAHARSQYARIARAERLMQLVRDVVTEQYGWDATGPWQIVRTRFHGGGIVSTHRSLLAALKVIDGHKSDCTCGCIGLHLATDDLPGAEANDANGYSPYALTK